MANAVYIPIMTFDDYVFYPDWLQSPFNLSYAVEFAAGTVGNYKVFYTLDDPNDAKWTPIWLPDPINGATQSASAGGFYTFPIRGLKVEMDAIAGAGGARLAILQGMSSR